MKASSSHLVKVIFLFIISLFLVSLETLSQTTQAAGAWSTGSNWIGNAAPTSPIASTVTVNHAMTSIPNLSMSSGTLTFNAANTTTSTITVNGGTLDIKSNTTFGAGTFNSGATIYVRSGYSLTLNGNSNFYSASTIYVESGATLYINGSVALYGTAHVDGLISCTGGCSSTSGAVTDGSGDVYTAGAMAVQGGSMFGANFSCSSSCHGNQGGATCTTTNTITASQTICSGNTPSSLSGSNLGSGWNYQWQKSTTSSTENFSNISGATGQNYSPGSLTTTTWFLRVATNTSSSCFASSNAVQITVTATTGTHTWNGATSSDWFTTSNWSTCSVPVSTDDVIIPNTATNMPSINASATCNNLTINTGASLTNTSTGTLTIKGNLTLNGTYTDQNSTVFSGTSLQVISASSHFKNMTLNNSAGLRLDGDLTVDNTLTLTSGTLGFGTTAKNVTIVGNISGSGGISMTGTGLAHSLTLQGSSNVAGSFTTTTGSGSNVTYSVNGNQTMMAGTYQKLSCTGGGTKTMNGTTTLEDYLTIASGVTLADGGYTLTEKGHISNNGSHTGTGKISLTGGSAQHILSGTGSYTNLELNDALGATVNSAMTIKGIYTPTAGTLTTNGNVTIDLSTGAVSGSGSGSVSGNLNVKKTLSSTLYHYLAAPIAGITPSQISDDVYLYAMYSYNESIVTSDSMQGWTSITNFASSMSQMTGYASYITTTGNINLTGTYNHSASFSSTLTHTNTNSGNLNTGGWNLVGNPFPSTIDWLAASGWTKTGLDNAIYLWDGANQRYASYVSGTGTNGGTQYVPSMQGFFVHVSAQGTGTLGMNNNVRVTSTNPGLWKMNASENTLHLSVRGESNISDETVIRMLDNATSSFDTELDAYKLYNDSDAPDLCSKTGATEYSINSLPLSGNTMSIPLKLKVNNDGNYTFTAEGAESFGSDCDLVFSDIMMKVSQDLKLNPVYTCRVIASDTSSRFFLNLRKAETISENLSPLTSIYGYMETVNVRFVNTNSVKASVLICNAMGEKIFSSENIDISSGFFSVTIPSIPPGIYLVKVVTSEGVTSSKVFLGR